MLVRAGHLVDAAGARLHGALRRSLAPADHLLHGAEDRHYLAESSERTYQHLLQHNGPTLYRRHVLPGYGHIDPLIGRDAAREVYPLILASLSEPRPHIATTATTATPT